MHLSRGSCQPKAVKRTGRWLATLAALPLAGCIGVGYQDMLNPKGPQAARIAEWFYVSTAVGTLVFLAYCAILGIGIYRARRNERRYGDNDLPRHHGRNLLLYGGVVGPAIILIVFLVYSVYVDRLLAALDNPGQRTLEIEVTGHQFWWQVRYLDPEGRAYRSFVTANEIHIPTGQPVRILLRTRDVIHSFWVPNLHGKMDMIPGRTNTLVIRADEAGVYRGQCAEFCGAQHAKMAFFVVAVPPAEFAAWWEHQLRPHQPPLDPVLARGQEAFMRNGCALCHAIRGTEAAGRAGPDLSHFGTRRSIGAGILPNTRGHLGGWISDPQGLKSGNFMPAVPLDSESLQALLSYLHSLR